MNNVQELVNKILSWGCPTLIIIGIMVAAIMTAVFLMGGMSSHDGMARKEMVKKISWTWICAIAIVLIPTFVLIFKGEIISEFGS